LNWKENRPFLASGVPNLSLDNLGIDIQTLGGELNSYGRLGLQIELVPREAREQVGLPHAGIADQNQLEKVIVLVISLVPRHRWILPEPSPTHSPLSFQLIDYDVTEKEREWERKGKEGREFSICGIGILNFLAEREKVLKLRFSKQGCPELWGSCSAKPFFLSFSFLFSSISFLSFIFFSSNSLVLPLRVFSSQHLRDTR